MNTPAQNKFPLCGEGGSGVIQAHHQFAGRERELRDAVAVSRCAGTHRSPGGPETTLPKPLFTPPPADGNLTNRQNLVYQAIDQDGITATQAGQLLHAKPGWEATAGRQVLTELRKRKLVIRRQRTGLWHRIQPKTRKPLGDLPADF